MPPKVAIFTDLDGTLLRHHDYIFADVECLLQELRDRSIPLILASSKTRAEIEYYREVMRLADPFIVENGGAIFIPQDYFQGACLHQWRARFRSCDEYTCLELGRPYGDLVQILNEIRSEADISLIGFHEMDEEQIVRHTDLDPLQARLAARRQYDEPFLILGRTSPAKVTNLKGLAAKRGCKIVQGGRFYHLTGRTDKGRAVRILMRFYRAAQEFRSFIGLGDCENDLSLLESVDVPILMANPDGSFNAQVLRRIPYVRRAPAGPQGWLQSVTGFLQYQES